MYLLAITAILIIACNAYMRGDFIYVKRKFEK
jgi:hypothetical protein